MGLMWGLFSVIIASAAQLSLGYAASHLPPMTQFWDFIAAFFALYHQRAHQLGIPGGVLQGQVLVWIASMVLPGWEGTFSLKALLGVACIMSGLMLIFLPTTKQRY